MREWMFNVSSKTDRFGDSFRIERDFKLATDAYDFFKVLQSTFSEKYDIEVIKWTTPLGSQMDW